ncbi:MAG: tetratricopeptide repeat protein [Pseudomonadota bacterium]|nr:tetratricopeptide repeat protein [Pseudomonadota bacterium]
MVDPYRTEEEQIEALKRGWQRHGRSIVTGILVALAGVFGWQAWQRQQSQQEVAAFAGYQGYLEALVQAESQSENADAAATAAHLANELKENHARTAYAGYAAWHQARRAVAASDLETAETELRWALDHTDRGFMNGDDAPMAAISRLRLAQVLLAQARLDDALEVLNAVQDKAYTVRKQALLGDLWLAKGEPELALAAFQQALAAGTPGDPTTALVEIKAAQLAGPATSNETQDAS